MRASSLSDERVIRLVSAYFVPVHVSRDHYEAEGADPETQRELERIDRERKEKKLEGGIVAVYVLDPDGAVVASIAVQKAFYPDKLVAFLENLVADRKLQPRDEAAVKAVAAPPPPKPQPHTPDGRLLTAFARWDDKGEKSTSAETLDLVADSWKSFTPPDDAKPGAAWTVPEATADRLLELVYPPDAHWSVKENRLTVHTLTAELVGVEDGVCVVRLRGKVEMFHPYTGKPGDNRISARLTGYARYDRARQKLLAFSLAAEEATYQRYYQGQPLPPGGFRFGVGLE